MIKIMRGRPAVAPEKILMVLSKRPLKWKEIKEKTGLPGATISQAIKRMKAEGLITLKVVEDRPCWDLTPKGMNKLLLLQPENKELEKKLKEWDESKGFSVEISELYPDAWWNFIKKVIDDIGIENLVDESKLRELVDQTKPVLGNMWAWLVHQGYIFIGYIITMALIFRHFVPSPPGDEDLNLQDRLIESGTKLMNLWENLVIETIKLNFRNLESLVDYNDKRPSQD